MRAAAACLARAALPRRRARPSMASLDSNDAAEVVPLEEDIDVLESDMTEQPLVFFEAVRDEDVLQRLALLRDFQVAVALAPFHLIVMIDEQPVERGMLAENLFHEQEAAVVVEPAVYARDQRLAIQWPDKLQREHHERDRRVLHVQPIVQILMLEGVGPGESRRGKLLVGLADHVLGRIQPDKANVELGTQHRTDGEKGIRRRAAEVIDGAAIDGKV